MKMKNRRGLAGGIYSACDRHPSEYPRDNLALYRLLGGIFQADAAAEQLCIAFENAYADLDCPSLHNVFCTVSGKTRG
jgi:hypothetical protein